MPVVKINPPAHALDFSYVMPGSKSYTNRALIIGALIHGKTTIKTPSSSEDSRAMASALWQMGFGIRPEPIMEEIVIDNAKNQKTPEKNTENTPTQLYCGHGGTVARFLASLCAITKGTWHITGSKRLCQRPIAPLVTALQQMGADITYLENKGCLPIQIIGKNLKGGTVNINASVSSQFLTSLMLIAPNLEEGLRICLEESIASTSYLKMTLQIMQDFGVTVQQPSGSVLVIPKEAKYTPRIYKCEPDMTGAGYLFAMAMITGGRFTLKNMPRTTFQADFQVPYLLEVMGAKLTKNSEQEILTLEAPAEIIPLSYADLSLLPDSAQTLAVLNAFAGGTTELTGLGTLPHKECDRITCTATELENLGIKTEISKEKMVIYGQKVFINAPIHIKTYDDHRMAMSFALAGLKTPVIIEDPGCVAKSFPEFWQVLEQAGVELEWEE